MLKRWTALSLLALGLIIYVTQGEGTSIVDALSGTTALLLLCVFTIVNIACIVVRRRSDTTPSFRAPWWTPFLGAVTAAFLVGPWTDRDTVEYKIAGVLIGLGVVLWVVTWLINRGGRAKRTGFRHPEDLSG